MKLLTFVHLICLSRTALRTQSVTMFKVQGLLLVKVKEFEKEKIIIKFVKFIKCCDKRVTRCLRTTKDAIFVVLSCLAEHMKNMGLCLCIPATWKEPYFFSWTSAGCCTWPPVIQSVNSMSFAGILNKDY